jgi:hypothetical protein
VHQVTGVLELNESSLPRIDHFATTTRMEAIMAAPNFLAD